MSDLHGEHLNNHELKRGNDNHEHGNEMVKEEAGKVVPRTTMDIEEEKGEKVPDVAASTTPISKKKEAPSRRHLLKRGVSVASSTPSRFLEAAEAAEVVMRKTIEPQKSYVDREVQEVPIPERALLALPTLFANGVPDYEILKEHLLKEGKLEENAANALIDMATAVLHDEPTLLELDAPFTVCGDVHGQFYDLVNLIEQAGHPSSTSYLFLGDYVDRGYFSVEVCFLLFCLKVSYPNSFYLLRGNHESRQMTNAYTFKMECAKKYSMEMYEKFMYAFDCMPLAATIRCKNMGTFFCVHGGLSPDIETLDDIKKLNRFDEVPDDGPICDLLWSDPVLEEDMDIKEFLKFSYDDNVERGLGKMFGYRAVANFLHKNLILAIIRAHEVQEEGCLEHSFTRTDRKIPMVITLFSAPNYCDMYSNKGAFMKFYDSKYEIYQFESVPHPYWLPNFQNAIAYTMDTVLDEVRLLLINIALLGIDEDEKDWTEETKSTYMKKILSPPQLLSPRQQELELQNLPNSQKFKKAKSMDKVVEKIAPTKKNGMRGKLKRHNTSFF